MANSKIFASASRSGTVQHRADMRKIDGNALQLNAAGGHAYKNEVHASIVQMAVTGTFRDGFYECANTQLNSLLDLLSKADARFVAQVAIYSRRQAHMKDMPAFLLAWLSRNDGGAFESAFKHVIDDGKMLKVFTQIIRSGVIGKSSFGSQAKRLMAHWIREASDKRLLAASIGNKPSLADVIRLVHPRPKDESQAAMFGWVLGREVDEAKLPACVRQLKAFRAGDSKDLPDVPFMLLTSMELDTAGWTQVFLRATFQQLRMNLATFKRHGVFDNGEMLDQAVARLNDAKAIEEAKVFPHQLLAAANAFEDGDYVSQRLRAALFSAMDHALANIPQWSEKKVAVLLDVSGSMKSPVTGRDGRKPASKVSCAEAAGLMAAMIYQRNPGTHFITFDTVARKGKMPLKSSLQAVYEAINFNGGGTDCASGLNYLSREYLEADYVIMLSDNESHKAMTRRSGGYHSRTGAADAWNALKTGKNKHAKMVCIDFAPNTTVQVPDVTSVMNIGGLTDDVFRVTDNFFTEGVVQQSDNKEVDYNLLVKDIMSIDLEEFKEAA